jgi:uncharacterized protein (UPF0333 family)
VQKAIRFLAPFSNQFKMISKRGQITVFIVVGIILVLAVGIVFGVRSSTENIGDEQITPIFDSSVKNYVEACIETTAEKALKYVSLHGGYYELPLLTNFKSNLPYYLYQGNDNSISKEELEKQISLYMDNELFFCIRNFNLFKKLGLDIEQKDVKTSSVINDDKVIFDVTFPITIKQDTLVKELVQFSTFIPSRIGILHNAATTFVNGEIPTELCASCLLNLAFKHNFKASMDHIEDDAIKFTIKDELSDLVYIFLNQYQFERTFNG